MNHASEGMLQAYLDDELALPERAALVRHLEACAACVRQLEALRSAAARFSAALRRIDRPAPVGVARTAVSSRHRAGAMRAYRRPLMRAAALVAFCTTAAAAALPQSPIRRWAAELWTETAASPEAEPALSAAQPILAEQTVPATSGISILPTGDRVRILLEQPAPQARIRVRLVDGARAAVYADYAGAAAQPPEFRTGPDRIEVSGAGSGVVVRIELPLALPYASIEVDGRVYVAKDGAALRLLAPTVDSVGAEVVFSCPCP